MVWLGPLGQVDPATGRTLVLVPYARPEDLAWLNRAAEPAGRFGDRYVLAVEPDGPDRRNCTCGDIYDGWDRCAHADDEGVAP